MHKADHRADQWPESPRSIVDLVPPGAPPSILILWTEETLQMGPYLE